MKIQVRLNNYRRSARKVREIAPVLRGLNVRDAINQLAVMQKGSASDLKVLLESAIASAKNDFNLAESNLVVGEIMIQEGKTLKRWRARAYGRAAQILKRTCHVLLTIEEDVVKADTEKVAKVAKKAAKTVVKKKTVKKVAAKKVTEKKVVKKNTKSVDKK